MTPACKSVASAVACTAAAYMGGFLSPAAAAARMRELPCSRCRHRGVCPSPAQDVAAAARAGAPVQVLLSRSGWRFRLPGVPSGAAAFGLRFPSGVAPWPALFRAFGLPVPEWAA